MILSLLGSPRSGKTTVAARVFSNLKEASFGCEFIPEQARLYIAEKRVNNNLKPSDSLTLSDQDQVNIMAKQFLYQQLMLKACGDGAIIVTDSSPLNALLYMSEDSKNTNTVKELVAQTLQLETLYFYCAPVEWLGGLDPNRIHSREQSLAIDSNIITTIYPLLKTTPLTLIGEPENRWRFATSEILRVLMSK